MIDIHKTQKSRSRPAKKFPKKTEINNRLEVIRNAHSWKTGNGATERMEDYLEVMYELVQHKGYATSIDTAECLGVSQPSVSKMMRRLDQCGLIEYEKYRGTRLTQKGFRIARAIHKTHSIISEFLRLIGVSQDITNRDAEEIEHHLHPRTLRKLQVLLRSMRNTSLQ